jgi:hypothetical protein
MADDHVIGAPERGTRRVAAALILVTILLDMLSTGIVIPILPRPSKASPTRHRAGRAVNTLAQSR